MSDEIPSELAFGQREPPTDTEVESAIKEPPSLHKALTQLADAVKVTIEKGLANDTLPKHQIPSTRWRVVSFRYTDQGPKDLRWQREETTILDWGNAKELVAASIGKTSEYTTASSLYKVDEVSQPAPTIDRFVERLMHHRLYRGRLTDEEITLFVTTFVREIANEAVDCTVISAIDGLILQEKDIQVSDIPFVVLRQTEASDYDHDADLLGFGGSPFEQPQAIINIQMRAKTMLEVQEAVPKVLALLRLFKAVSVKAQTYTIGTFSVSNRIIPCTFRSDVSETPLHPGILTSRDAELLPRFYSKMSALIPSELYALSPERIGPLALAYQRYCDALLRSRVIEQRLASAVMGLEGLFVKAEEKELLGLRLSTRLAKVLSSFGYDALKVQQQVKDGYLTRSIFVHGHQLSTRDKRSLEKKHGSLESLWVALLEELRIALVVFILLKEAKDTFLNKVDHAMIDRAADKCLDEELRLYASDLGIRPENTPSS